MKKISFIIIALAALLVITLSQSTSAAIPSESPPEATPTPEAASCFDDCIAGGNTPTECNAACQPTAAPLSCYDGCLANGNTPIECNQLCNPTPVDINACTDFDAQSVINKLPERFGSDLGISDFLYSACGGSNPNAPQPTPGGPGPTVPPGSGNLLDLSEFLNATIPSTEGVRSAATSCLKHRSAYENVCQTFGFDNPICIGVLAGIDYKENLCRGDYICKDGLTKIGEPVYGLNNCDVTETLPGAPVKIGSGCGFTDKEHSLRWCLGHFLGKSQTLNGKTNPETMEEIIVATAGYNGVHMNGNCRTDMTVPYNFCPPELKEADNLYPMNKYMCPTFPNYCDMHLINCGTGQCEMPHPYNQYGVLTVGREYLRDL